MTCQTATGDRTCIRLRSLGNQSRRFTPATPSQGPPSARFATPDTGPVHFKQTNRRLHPSVIVVGGGAAGYLAAITAAEAGASVAIVERAPKVLAKVKISGGGRCNVTHACFEPKRLASFYPRGARELVGPFHRFQPRDTMDWFQQRGVDLKTERDGRVFPVTDRSQTIVDALTHAAHAAGVRVHTGVALQKIVREPEGGFLAEDGHTQWRSDRLLLATGSGLQGHAWAKQFGHTIVPPVPSLFSFSVNDPRLKGLSGISVENADLSVEGISLRASGPLLITHEGLSGPAVLKLSAWGARVFHDRRYTAVIQVNWLNLSRDEFLSQMAGHRKESPRKSVIACGPPSLPQRLWKGLVQAVALDPDRRWGDLTKAESNRLAEEVVCGRFEMTGKGAFKDEFVTAGGVSLQEINFATMESRVCPGLYFAGEIVDIDGLTGGFNFQSAWTTGWIAGGAMAKDL